MSPPTKGAPIWSGAALLICLGWIGCSSDPMDTGPPSKYGTFEDVVASGGEWIEDKAETTYEIVEDYPESREDGSFWACQRQQVNLETNPEMFLLYNSGVGVYPGAVLQGGHLEENPPPLVIGDRGSGSVLINLFTGEGESVERQLQTVRQGSVTDAINSLIRDRTLFPDNFLYTVKEVYNKEHLRIEMGLKVRNFEGSSLATELGYTHTAIHRYFLVRLIQPFYEIIFEGPAKVSDWWAPGVAPDDLAPYIGANNPPVYIRSVRYGRLVYIVAKTTSTDDKYEADLKAVYQGAVRVEGNVDSEYQRVTSTSEFQAIVYGGSMDIGALEGKNFQALRTALNDGKQIELGLPISYTLEDLQKRQPVRTKETTTYDVTECIPVDGGLTDPLFIWDTVSVDRKKVSRPIQYDTVNDRYVMWTDLRNKDTLVATRLIDGSDNGLDLTAADDASAPVYIGPETGNPDAGATIVDGVKGPVVEFHHFQFGTSESTPNNFPPVLRTQMVYAPDDLQDTDYTILAVFGTPGTSTLRIEAYSTWSKPTSAPYVFYSDQMNNWDEPGRNLLIGWDGGVVGENCPFRFRHEGVGGGDVLLPVNANTFHVFGIRFSQTDGTDLFIDGDLMGSRPGATDPLRRYELARLGAFLYHAWDEPPGAGVLSRIRVRRVEAYQRTLSDGQIEARSKSMRRAYIR